VREQLGAAVLATPGSGGTPSPHFTEGQVETQEEFHACPQLEASEAFYHLFVSFFETGLTI
jgi:hypothetical protein